MQVLHKIIECIPKVQDFKNQLLETQNQLLFESCELLLKLAKQQVVDNDRKLCVNNALNMLEYLLVACKLLINTTSNRTEHLEQIESQKYMEEMLLQKNPNQNLLSIFPQERNPFEENGLFHIFLFVTCSKSFVCVYKKNFFNVEKKQTKKCGDDLLHRLE